MSSATVLVIKRNGNREPFQSDKLYKRIFSLDQDESRSKSLLALIIPTLSQDMTTAQLDDLISETAMTEVCNDPAYMKVASGVAVSALHKETPAKFSEAMKLLPHVVTQDIIDLAPQLDEHIVHERDFEFDYFGFLTLRNSYLLKNKGVIVERPQYTIMRVSLGIHGSNLERAIETYHHISLRYFTHATPTLFNAGTHRSQCSSCFLIAMQDDSIEGIYGTLSQCAKISKWAGGIGLHIHNI